MPDCPAPASPSPTGSTTGLRRASPRPGPRSPWPPASPALATCRVRHARHHLPRVATLEPLASAPTALPLALASPAAPFRAASLRRSLPCHHRRRPASTRAASGHRPPPIPAPCRGRRRRVGCSPVGHTRSAHSGCARCPYPAPARPPGALTRGPRPRTVFRKKELKKLK